MILLLSQVEFFSLILARIFGFFGQATFFEHRSIPIVPKVGICFFISMMIWTALPPARDLPGNFVVFALALVQEYFIGKLIGFVCFIIVKSILAAGDLMGMQMGLSVANQFDPGQGIQMNIVGRLFDFTALLFFLVVNGHLMVLGSLMKSFYDIPVFSMINIANPILHIVSLGVSLWGLAVRLASPVILTIFLLDFAFGTISSVAPQVNVFMLAFQVKPMLGLTTLYLTIPLLVWQVINIINKILDKIIALIGLF